MPVFKDALGREWTIEITGIEVKRIRSALQVDLMGYLDRESNLLDRLSDPVLLVDVISELLTDQIRSRGLGEREFALGLVGGAMDEAIDCLVRAIVLFSRPRQGQILERMAQETKALQQRTAEKVLEKIPAIVAQQEAKVDARLSSLNG